MKIGRQFVAAHTHGSPRELRIAMERGAGVDLPLAYGRLGQPSVAEASVRG